MQISIDGTLHQVILAYAGAIAELQRLAGENEFLRQENKRLKEAECKRDGHRTEAEILSRVS